MPRMRLAHAAPRAVAIASIVAACGGGATGGAAASDETDAGAIAPAAPCPGPSFDTLSDGAVVAVLEAQHVAEVDLARRIAWRLSTHDGIVFAEKSVTDHTLLLAGLRGAMRSDHVALIGDDLSVEIGAAEEREVEGLSVKSGVEVDRTYLAHEVLGHLREIAVLDRMLAPAARDRRVADAIRSTRAIAVDHLQRAMASSRALQSAP